MLIISGVILGAGLLLGGCSGPKVNSGYDSTTAGAAWDPNAEEHNLIRKGDAMTIQLSGVPPSDQASYPVKVDDNGNISMPLIGNVKAAGTTTANLKNTIEDLYKTKRIYTSPNITIYTMQERYVSVLGEVRNPLQIPYSRDLTVLSAIAHAGGFTDYANRSKCKLLRGDKVIEFNSKEILKDPRKDIPLIAGDRIQIDRTIFLDSL